MSAHKIARAARFLWEFANSPCTPSSVSESKASSPKSDILPSLLPVELLGRAVLGASLQIIPQLHGTNTCLGGFGCG
jgi:hypothetical protein